MDTWDSGEYYAFSVDNTEISRFVATGLIRPSNFCESSQSEVDFKTKFNALLNNINPTLTLKLFVNLNEPSTDELIYYLHYKLNIDLGAIEI